MPTPTRYKPKFLDSFARFLDSEQPADIYLKIAIVAALAMLGAFINSFNNSNF